MASDPKKFKNLKAFCEHYEQRINGVDCLLGGEKLKSAALEIIQLLKEKNVTQSSLFQGPYEVIRIETGLQDKSLSSKVANSPDHYHLALIARDMFKDIIENQIENPGNAMSVAVSQSKRFIQKRYAELSELIGNYEATQDLKSEVEGTLFENALILFEKNQMREKEGRTPRGILTIEDLTKFVELTEKSVHQTLSISDRKPFVTQEAGVYCDKNYRGAMPKDSLLSKVFLPERGQYHNTVDPFIAFEQASQKFDSSNSTLIVLQDRMSELKVLCKKEAPIAKYKGEFCNEYAPEQGLKKGLYIQHEAIYNNIREVSNTYAKQMHRPSFMTKQIVQSSMKDLNQMAVEISRDCKAISFRAFSYEDLNNILAKFKGYEKTLGDILGEYTKQYGSESKAEKVKEYKTIDAIYKEIKSFNSSVEEQYKQFHKSHPKPQQGEEESFKMAV